MENQEELINIIDSLKHRDHNSNYYWNARDIYVFIEYDFYEDIVDMISSINTEIIPFIADDWRLSVDICQLLYCKSKVKNHDPLLLDYFNTQRRKEKELRDLSNQIIATWYSIEQINKYINTHFVPSGMLYHPSIGDSVIGTYECDEYKEEYNKKKILERKKNYLIDEYFK